jgi:hypothetical protein
MADWLEVPATGTEASRQPLDDLAALRAVATIHGDDLADLTGADGGGAGEYGQVGVHDPRVRGSAAGAGR